MFLTGIVGIDLFLFECVCVCTFEPSGNDGFLLVRVCMEEEEREW